jgi:hypothetical protein
MPRTYLSTEPIRLIHPHGGTGQLLARDEFHREAAAAFAARSALKSLPTAQRGSFARRSIGFAGDLTVRFGQFLQRVDTTCAENPA